MVVGVLGVVTSCLLCARVSRVLRDVKTTGRISCATDNTYTPAHNVSTNFSAGFGCSCSRSHRTFLARSRQCRNPSCSSECESVATSEDGSISNAAASVLGHHCDLRDVRYAVLRVSGVVSIFDFFFQNAKLQRNCSIPTRAAVFPRKTSVICSVVRLIIDTAC